MHNDILFAFSEHGTLARGIEPGTHQRTKDFWTCQGYPSTYHFAACCAAKLYKNEEEFNRPQYGRFGCELILNPDVEKLNKVHNVDWERHTISIGDDVIVIDMKTSGDSKYGY